MFISTNEPGYLKMLLQLILLAITVFVIGAFISVSGQTARHGAAAQRTPASLPADEQPLLREYRGIALGMTAQEVRGKLGEPADKSDEQDFYNFSEAESAQVFYDTSGKVKAVSAHFTGNALVSAPTAKSIVGDDATPRADGSVFKLVRYTRAGYWVSYSRTAGDAPVVTVSMQKFN